MSLRDATMRRPAGASRVAGPGARPADLAREEVVDPATNRRVGPAQVYDLAYAAATAGDQVALRRLLRATTSSRKCREFMLLGVTDAARGAAVRELTREPGGVKMSEQEDPR